MEARLYDRGLKTVAWSASKSGEIKTSSVQLDIQVWLGIPLTGHMAEKDKDTRSKLCSLSLGLFSDHDDAEIISIEKNFLDFLFVVANLGKSQEVSKR